MPGENPDSRRLKEDVDAIEEKYGAFADVYAESRSEAAETAGDEDAKRHWEKVAAAMKGDDRQ
jgi:hypothetical protein